MLTSHPRPASPTWAAAPPLANSTARRRHSAHRPFPLGHWAPPKLALPRSRDNCYHFTEHARPGEKGPRLSGRLYQRGNLPQKTPIRLRVSHWPALGHMPSPKPITTKETMTHLHGPEPRCRWIPCLSNGSWLGPAGIRKGGGMLSLGGWPVVAAAMTCVISK